MIESKFFNDLAQVKVDEAVAEAVTKTEIRTNREFIQELLRDRIGPPPTDLVAALAVIADRARLSVLRRIAGQVSSFEQFRQEAGL